MSQRNFVLRFFVAACVSAICFSSVAPAQERPTENGRPVETLKVFLFGPDAASYAADLPFAELVSDAQVVVEFAPARDAEGDHVAFSFTGCQAFAGRMETMKYRPAPNETAETTRKGIGRLLQMGLLSYAAKTSAAERIDVIFLDQVKPTAVVDPWHFWVFNLSANGILNGQKAYQTQSWYGSLSVNRVTPEWKIRMSLSARLSRNTYDYEGYNYTSDSRSRNAAGLVVRSLNDHWSVGAAVSSGSSSYSNQNFSLTVKPAVEFDFFPYSESTKKQLCILYYAGPEYYRYHEETIFDKRKETLWKEGLSFALDFKRPWGTISMALSGSHYFHDLRKNRLELDVEISWRIFKGLSFDVYGSGGRIRDQLSLPKGEATLEEVLLRRRELATGYNYYFSVGFSYTFGSVRSNLVNPRFESGSSASIQISM
jgi:hypothetical protein